MSLTLPSYEHHTYEHCPIVFAKTNVYITVGTEELYTSTLQGKLKKHTNLHCLV